MKIYFAGSITGGRSDAKLYKEFISELSGYGKVLTEHVGLKSLSAMGEVGLSDEFVFNRDVNWILESDIVIAEVTTPSLGVGYEICLAELNNKRIIALYRPSNGKRLSKMIQGNKKVEVFEYKSFQDLKIIFKGVFDGRKNV